MTPSTAKALAASIAKWKRNTRVKTPTGVKIGASVCPLCVMFHPFDKRAPCVGCPVFAKTGEPGCGGSPYGDAEVAFDAWDDVDDRAAAEAFRAAAQAEVAFLESLVEAPE